ncbi:MAG: PAS domain S-box protein [Planctomycetota bacterium]
MTDSQETRLPWWQYLVVGGSQLLLGLFGNYVYQEEIHISVGWPAIAFGAVFLTQWGFRLWPAILVGSSLVHFFFGKDPGWFSSFFVLGEVGETVVAAWMLQWRMKWSKGFRTVRQLRHGAMVGLLAPLIGAASATFAIYFAMGEAWTPATGLGVFFGWWMRSALGFWMVAPALGAWFNPDRKYLGPFPWEGAIAAIAVVCITFLAFVDGIFSIQTPLWLALVAGIPLLWAGARCGLWLASHLSLVVLAGASYAALTNASIMERFADGDLRAMWWMLLDISAISTVTLAVLNDRANYQARRLVLARDRLELLIHDSPLALIEWDLHFRARRWSRRATEIFGYTAEQALGVNGADLLVLPEDRTVVMERWAMVLGGQAGVRTTNRNLTASGKTLHCDWYGSPVHDERGRVIGVVSLVEDVTVSKETELALAASEQHFQSVAEVLPQFISYYSSDLELKYANHAFLKVHGHCLEELPLRLQDMVDQATLDRIMPNIEEALCGRPMRFLEKYRFQDEIEHDLDRVLLPDLNPEGQVRGFFSVCTDITEYRAAARERLALETQILQTQKLESLGLLSGKIAHEFNNRLFGILGHADMAREDLQRSPEDAKANLSKAIEIAREASDLCRQLFVYSGHGSGSKAVAGINPLVQEMRRLLELTLPRSVRLKTELADGLPDVQIDAAQLRQAIVNLVQNAAQAIGERRGEVLVRTRLVEASDCEFQESFLRESEEEHGTLVEIMVRDDGEGISASELGRVFEPFYTKRPGSRGLGLSGVLGIIHGHSGALAIESEVGIGSEVRLYLAVAGDA